MAKSKVARPEVVDDPETNDELVDQVDPDLGGESLLAAEVEVDLGLVGIDAGKTGSYEMVTPPKGEGLTLDSSGRVRDRTIRLGNMTLEHTHDDEYGRWCYRKQD